MLLIATLLLSVSVSFGDHTDGHNTPGEPLSVTLPSPDLFSMVPMRDGTKLATYILLPENSEEPVPTILIRSVYKDGVIPWGAYNFQKYLDAGYAYVFQSTRGTGASEGRFRFMVDEFDDGYDTVEWIAEQPWSDGNVGMNNGSYLGMTQLAAASRRPPHLKAIAPHVPTANMFRETPYNGGIFMRYHMLNWHRLISIDDRSELGVGFLNPQAALQDPATVARLSSRPLIDSGNGYLAGDRLEQFRELVRNEIRSAYWDSMELGNNDYLRIDAAVLLVGGVFDPSVGVLGTWRGLEGNASVVNRRHMIIGPWTHGQTYHAGVTSNGVHEMGEIALVDMDALRIAFFDHYLKGDAASKQELPDRVRLFVTGSNRWLELENYPLPQSTMKTLFLDSGGDAVGVDGGGRLRESINPGTPDSIVVDPANPTIAKMELAKASSYYQDVEQGDDVLVYTSEPLDRPLTIVGEPTVNLSVSISTPDADVIVRLTEVYPDGRSVSLGKGGALRLRFRDGFDNPTLLIPEHVYQVEIPLTLVSHTVAAGHRLRLNVLGTEFPLFDPNPNTGEDVATAVAMQKSVLTIHHSQSSPSQLSLPLFQD